MRASLTAMTSALLILFPIASRAEQNITFTQWLDGFVGDAANEHTFQLRPAQIKSHFGLIDGRKIFDCYSLLDLGSEHPNFITAASGMLLDQGSTCDDYRIGVLEFTLTSDPGLVATILERVSGDLGLNPSEVDASPNLLYRWQVSDHTALVMTIFGGDTAMNNLSLTLAHVANLPVRRKQ